MSLFAYSDAVRLRNLGVDLRNGMNVLSVQDIFFESENDGETEDEAEEEVRDKFSDNGEEAVDEDGDGDETSVALLR